MVGGGEGGGGGCKLAKGQNLLQNLHKLYQWQAHLWWLFCQENQGDSIGVAIILKYYSEYI